MAERIGGVPGARAFRPRMGAVVAFALLVSSGIGPLFASIGPRALVAQSLRGSHRSLDVQNRVAGDHDFTFLSTPADVERFVDLGLLVPLRGDGNYRVHRVSFPWVRPEVRTFVERLASQYRSACGRRLVVTSATRPENRQPRNASSRSVHPTGMAVDLRRSNYTACRSWLENVLLYLERQGVVEATRESRPPHYHVAVFPKPYAGYVARLAGREEVPGGVVEYQVRSGDSLWGIARRTGVTVNELRAANRLSTDRIHPGQKLQVPVSGNEGAVATALDYRVRAGDSLWRIARIHRTTVERIRRENDLATNRIFAGQILRVPVGR